MLYHHDSRSYDEAASDAATRARAKMEKIIADGKGRAVEVIEQVQEQIPTDRVVPGEALKFVPVSEGVELVIGDQGQEAIHDHALGQMASRGNLPMAYVRSLQNAGGDWGQALLAHNLTELYTKADAGKKRYLTRSITNGHAEVRGFLSDRYRRLDSRPLLDSFCGAANDLGMIPVTGYACDTKVALKALLPCVFEPVPNEVVCFGIAWENSDFGNGVHAIRDFMMRLWCTNYAISTTTMRQVHVGKRLSADFSFSQQTHALDSKAAASAVRDIVSGLLTPPKVAEQCALIKQAHEEEVSPTQVASFLKKNLNKGEAEKVTKAFNSADIVNMPAGQSKWRLSNAISWVAGDIDNKERSLELMKVAHKATV